MTNLINFPALTRATLTRDERAVLDTLANMRGYFRHRGVAVGTLAVLAFRSDKVTKAALEVLKLNGLAVEVKEGMWRKA